MRKLIFTAYNRPQYFQPTMEAWSQVRGYPQWQPQVFLEPSNVADDMTRIAQDHGAQVTRNSVRHGVLYNPWHALNTAFSQDNVEFVVLAEDDVLVSDDILEYFNWSAHRYYNETVLAVGANNHTAQVDPVHEYAVQRCDAFNPLIWGTWPDRWTAILRDTWDLDYSSGTPEHPQSGWDWNINLRILKQTGMEIVQPLASRSTHIGEHMGTHTTAATFQESVSPTFRQHRPPGQFHVR